MFYSNTKGEGDSSVYQESKMSINIDDKGVELKRPQKQTSDASILDSTENNIAYEEVSQF